MEAEEEVLPTDGRKLIDQEGPLGLEEEEEVEECITSCSWRERQDIDEPDGNNRFARARKGSSFRIVHARGARRRRTMTRMRTGLFEEEEEEEIIQNRRKKGLSPSSRSEAGTTRGCEGEGAVSPGAGGRQTARESESETQTDSER